MQLTPYQHYKMKTGYKILIGVTIVAVLTTGVWFAYHQINKTKSESDAEVEKLQSQMDALTKQGRISEAKAMQAQLDAAKVKADAEKKQAQAELSMKPLSIYEVLTNQVSRVTVNKTVGLFTASVSDTKAQYIKSILDGYVSEPLSDYITRVMPSQTHLGQVSSAYDKLYSKNTFVGSDNKKYSDILFNRVNHSKDIKNITSSINKLKAYIPA